MTKAFVMARNFLQMPLHVRWQIIRDLGLMTIQELHSTGTEQQTNVLAFRRAKEMNKVNELADAIGKQGNDH